MFANFEERFGLINNSLKIYDRALKDMTDADAKYKVFNLYLAKTTEFHGITKTRQLFERCFNLLDGY